MAVASPPPTSPRAAGSSRASARPGNWPTRSRGWSRPAAIGALALAVVVVAYLALSGGSPVTYHLLFANAGQLVNGDQVQVGGVPVGSIQSITLTSDNQAAIAIRVSAPLAPLHQGTTAEIRATSLSGVANRYISLTPGANSSPTLPDGSTLPTTATQGIVDLDQLFDTLDPATRRGLAQVIQGSAVQYAGAEAALNQATRYFDPTLSATDALLHQLDLDQNAFTRFVVATSQTVTALAGRRQQLAGLVANADSAFGAIGSRSADLAAGLRALPTALRQGTTTLTNLSPALDDLTKLVDVSKPDTRTLAAFLDKLGPFLAAARTPVTDLGSAVSRPGAANDLTEATQALPALQTALDSASPHTIAALQAADPVTAFLRPYTPDLVGWLRDFGQGASYYDANGHYARISPVFADFGYQGNNLVPIAPAAGVAPLQTGQLRRCPGAATQPLADGSAPFTDGGTLDCDPLQVPEP